MASDSPTPLIALPACVREIGIHPFHVVGEKYITAVRDGAGGFPRCFRRWPMPAIRPTPASRRKFWRASTACCLPAARPMSNRISTAAGRAPRAPTMMRSATPPPCR